jgi:hypothetical protein
MPAITSGKYETREALELAVVKLYRQGDTLASISLKCEINVRSVQRILRKHGIGHGERLPGVRPSKPKPEYDPAARGLSLVRSPCWRAYCDDPKCAYHQEVSYVR